MPYVTTRRNFLYGGAATALAFWLRRAEAFAQGATSPKRFLVIHHPVGTVRQNWLCQGGETDFTLSRILKPFEPVRMHMAILSLCAGTPVLPIEYEFKTRELFANLGFERWVQDIQTVTSSNLVSAFDSFSGELDSHRQELMDAVTAQRQSACDSFDSVCELTGYASASASAEAE